MKKIILTGGGTAGHVTPNIALTHSLKEQGYEIYYIGSKNGIEKELIEKEGIPYFAISSGKLRRYFDLKNATDVFRVIKGFGEALRIIRKIKPDIVFSKGGFVAVPVAAAAGLKKIPLVCHESDITPGLANKLAVPFAKKVCVSFSEALNYIPDNKGILTGTAIRREFFFGSREKGLKIAGLEGKKPVLLIMGGSSGSVKINNAVKNISDELLKSYDIIHLCGKGNTDRELQTKQGFKQFEYISDELKDIFAASDMVLGRAGSNSIFEYLVLKKPMLLIPLSKAASRGDQILNAESFKKQGFAEVLFEEDMTGETLLSLINTLYKNRDAYIKKMSEAHTTDGVTKIIDVINSLL